MFKRIARTTRISTAILMVVSILMPTTVADAAGTITKQITVLGIDGQPYAGAQVAIGYQPNVGSIAQSAFTATQLTDSSGNVTLQYSDDLNYPILYVQPPVSDRSTAGFADRNLDFTSNSLEIVSLETASVFVELLKSNGDQADSGAQIFNGYDSSILTMRTGVVGVNFPDDAGAGDCTVFGINPNQNSIDSFTRNYSAKVTGTGSNRIVKIYSDVDSCQVEAPKLNGIYQLYFHTANLTGTLKSASGNTLNLSPDSTFKVEAYGIKQDETIDYQRYVPASYANAVGDWALSIDTSTAGKYLLTFAGFGGNNLPSFSEVFFYVTQDGKLSWNSDGSNPATAINDVRNIPTANTSFSFVETATSQGLPAYINISKQIGSGTTYRLYASTYPANGIARPYLTDGNYQVEINGAATGSSSFSVTVQGTSITAGTAAGFPYLKIGGDFTVRMPTSNVKIKTIDFQGNPVRTNIDICLKACYSGTTNSSGLTQLYVPNGTYSEIVANPINNPNLASLRTSGQVTAGVATIIGSSLGSNGELVLQIPTSNFKVRVIHPVTFQKLASASVIIYRRNTNGSNGAFASRPLNTSSGVFGTKLDDGDYNLEIYVHQGLASTAGLSNKVYRVSVANGSFSISDKTGAIINPEAGIYSLAPQPSNFTAVIRDPDGNLFASGYVQVYEIATNGSKSNSKHINLPAEGVISTYLETGTSLIVVNPYSATSSIVKSSYTAVTSNGVTTINGALQESSRWVLPLARPNILVSVSNPKTSSGDSNFWISVDSANESWGSMEWLENIDLSQTTPGFGATKLNVGKYLFTVNPHDDEANSGLSSQTYRVTVTDSGTSMTLGGNSIIAANGRFPLVPATSNFELQVKKPSGVIFTRGWVNFCKIIDIKFDSCIPGRWLSSDGKSSAFLTDGTWRVSVYPESGLTDVTQKSYEVVVTSGVASIAGQSATNGIWTLNTGTPNLSGTFSVETGTLTFGQNQNIGVELQKFVNGRWDYAGANSWTNTNGWAMSVTGTVGQYRLQANPWNFTELVRSNSEIFWINSSGQFATSETGTYLDSMTAVNIILRAPNLKLKVVNPLAQPGEANYLAPGGWVSIEKITGQNRTWVTNADIRAENPGLTGVNITENGTYNLRVNPPSGSNSLVGVAAKNYLMTVNGSDSITVTSGGVAVAKDGDRFVLQLATANVSARILRTDGTPAVQSNGRWVGVNLQKLNSWGDWDWIGGTNTDDNGYVSFRVDAAGKYRLRIEPYGDSLASVTFSTEFTVAANEIDTLNKQFGSITLAGPSIRISAASSAAPSVTLADTNIEIRKDGRWVDWANTGQGKIAGISFLSEGTYEITLNPSQDQIATSAKKSYKVIATKNSDGVIVGQVPAGDGVSVANGITTLLLGVPTLVGYVKDPNGTVVQPNAQVYAVDLNSGGEKWEFNATTNYLGRWSMILPAGRYKIYARAPWGTAEYGTSNGIGEVVVAENGSVTTPNGYPANAFNINLKAPTWSGVVKAPTGDTVIPQARICLLLSNNWNCTNADSVGRFALSMPETFNSFTGTNPILEVADDAGRAYPMNRVQGASNVSQTLGGTQNNSVVLRLKSPNTEITVTPSEGTLVASNLWVVAERDGVGYLGGGSTNNEGVVKLNIDSPNLPFKVKVDVNGNPEIAANFAPATKEWTSSQIASATTDSGTVNAVFHGAVTLSPPNFRFIVREPTTNADPVGNTWVELLGGNDGPWIGSTSVDYNGFGSFKLDVPSTGANNYVMIVHPSWNATTNFTKQAYGVTVAPNGNITVIHKTSITEVRTQVASGKTVFPLALGVPSVTGIVVDPDSNTVANSYVTPFDASNNQGLWQQGVSTRNSGQFAINLVDGLYKLEANVPWDMSGVAKSAQCEVRVETRTVTTGGSCIQSGTPNTVRLQLRAPNVKFTLKVGNTVIPYANVGVGAGKWWTNAQSNSEGVVSLFIDAVAIRELNNWSTSQKLWLWIDPPYGSSTMARWSCSSLDNKPLCKDLADVPANGDYVGKTSDNGAAWVVQGVTPNTRLKIVDPTSGDDLPNAWVSVLATNNNGNQWWLGGGNSGSDGYVGMNLETATAFSNGYNKLIVEVQAPWNQRTTLATNLYTNGTTGYTYESLTAVTNFSPATPNLKLLVRDSNNYINRYGWVGVEEVNSSNETIRWVGGYSLNEYGLGSVFLAANKRFKITSYPGPGRAGAATPCIVETNQSTPPVVATNSADCGGRSVANGELTIRLNGGNVVGTVTRADGSPVVGAAVYANLPGAATEVSAVITVTDETGHYDLQLTANQQWNLKVFPVPSATDNLQIKTHSSAITAPSTGANTINFTLDAVVG